MCTSQYGLPTANNPILFQNFTNVKDGLNIPNNYLKFEIILTLMIY